MPMTPMPPTLYGLRLEAGYRTQTAFAHALGLSAYTYGRIERGRQQRVSLRTLMRMAQLLHVSQAVLRQVLQ